MSERSKMGVTRREGETLTLVLEDGRRIDLTLTEIRSTQIRFELRAPRTVRVVGIDPAALAVVADADEVA